MLLTLLCLIVGGGISRRGGYFSRFSLSGGVVIKCPTGKIAVTLKEVEQLMIPPDGVE